MNLAEHIRAIPDHPKPGVLFRDVTTLMRDAQAFRTAVESLAAPFAGQPLDAVAGIEARGFIFGGALATRLGVGFVPLRKRGKLPHAVSAVEYELEYGRDVLEMHKDAVEPGRRVLLVDDLIATGGTALASITLLRGAGAEIVGAAFVVDLPDLGGAELVRRSGVAVTALVSFPGH